MLLDVVDLDRFAAADDDADQAVGDAERRMVDIFRPGAVAGAEFEPIAGGVEQHQRTDLGLHQPAGVAGDPLENVRHVERGDDGLRDAEQRLQLAGFLAHGGIEPGMVDHLGRVIGQRHQQFLVAAAERVAAGRIHVEHADQLVVDHQRHGQLAAHPATDRDVARVGGHVGHAERLPGLGDPAGHAAADRQLQLPGFFRKADGDFDLQQLGVRVDQDQRPAGGPHDPHRLAEHQVQHLRRFERRVDDLADPRQRFEPAQFRRIGIWSPWHTQDSLKTAVTQVKAIARQFVNRAIANPDSSQARWGSVPQSCGSSLSQRVPDGKNAFQSDQLEYNP